MEEAIRMCGLFIKPGPVAQLKDPTGAIFLLKGQPGKASYNGPMVVLDNKLTASASEIFSAAMQDYGRAVIVGDSSTYGKGTVQALIELGDLLRGHDDPVHSGGALKITMQKIYRVTGKSTQLKGVISDLTIPSLTDRSEIGESDRGHALADDDDLDLLADRRVRDDTGKILLRPPSCPDTHGAAPGHDTVATTVPCSVKLAPNGHDGEGDDLAPPDLLS